LRGAERVLFAESSGMITDLLADDDAVTDIEIFDNLQRNQKIAVHLEVSRALLLDSAPAPPLTAINEAAVAAAFQNIRNQVAQELEPTVGAGGDDAEWFGDAELDAGPSWRQLILNACRDTGDTDDLPEAVSSDNEEWELLIDCLQDRILWDDDWQLLAQLDAPPEASRRMKQELGIDDDYFVTVPPDPSDEEAARMIVDLRYLTPAGRGL